MIRAYSKQELLSCAAQLPNGAADIVGTMKWGLNAVSAITEDCAADLIRFTKFFARRKIKPTIKISDGSARKLQQMYSEYQMHQNSFFSQEEIRSVRAEQLVKMMEAMRS